MAPKRDKRGTPDKRKDTSTADSDILQKGSTLSVPNFLKEFAALCDEENTTFVPEIIVLGKESKIRKKSSEAIPVELPGESLENTESVLAEVIKRNIYVAFDNPEKYLNLKQIYVKDFRLERPLLSTLCRCISNNSTVSVLRLENCGLKCEDLELIVNTIVETKRITDVSLDGNHIPEQNYYYFLEQPTMVTHLSLRLCKMNDEGVALLANHLGYENPAGQLLISLNLNHNRITHVGAGHLANALRTNRTLLSLSLAGNKLQDAGAVSLATSLSKFELNHKEVVMRRRRSLARIRMRDELLEQYLKAAKSSPSGLGGGKTPSRQPSPMKTKRISVDHSVQRVGSSRKKFGSRDSRSQTRVGSARVGSARVSGTRVSGTRVSGTRVSSSRVPGKTPSTGSAAAHSASKEALKERERERASIEQKKIELLVEQQIETEDHPLSQDVWPEDRSLYSSGNRKLAHLNLAYNDIGWTGLLALSEALHYQDEKTGLLAGSTDRGIIKLTLQGNPIPECHLETLSDLQDLLSCRMDRSVHTSILSLGRSSSNMSKTSKTSSGTKQNSPKLS